MWWVLELPRFLPSKEGLGAWVTDTQPAAGSPSWGGLLQLKTAALHG